MYFFVVLYYCFVFMFIYFAVEPYAALLVQDDEADGGNVVGVCIRWARLLRTHLVFSGILANFLANFFF